MGAKHFSFDFDGGRTAPYHITEKRGRFVGSLWLGLKSLHWLIDTWGVLRQTAELKGFFRFLRTEYSTLELSCLQNQHGRFVEICEYHGGAQRGGIRIPEGFRGKNWDRFVRELHSFFPGTATAEPQAGEPCNGKGRIKLDKREIRAGASSVSEARNGNFELKSRDTRDLKKSAVIAELPRVTMNPVAPRPTRKWDFKWEPGIKTLRITKSVEGKRIAEWVGLKTKAVGLAQPINRALTQTQFVDIGLVDEKQDKVSSEQGPEPSHTSNVMADHSAYKELSSSDETHDDDECSLENSTPAFSHSLMGAAIVEPGCTAVEVGASDPLSTESTMPPQPV
jgi:hypothetical protein